MKGDWKNNIIETHPKNVTEEEIKIYYKNIANYCQYFYNKYEDEIEGRKKWTKDIVK